jgi:hypothetical protein
MKSKFNFLPFFIASIVTLIPLSLIFMWFRSPKAGTPFLIFLLLFMGYFWLTEFRTRAHRVILKEKELLLRPYFGLGKSRSYSYTCFEGFNTSLQPGKLGAKEYIFLMKGDRRVASVSEFYHSNYVELKSSLEEKVKFLGDQKFKLGYEYRQMFR